MSCNSSKDCESSWAKNAKQNTVSPIWYRTTKADIHWLCLVWDSGSCSSACSSLWNIGQVIYLLKICIFNYILEHSTMGSCRNILFVFQLPCNQMALRKAMLLGFLCLTAQRMSLLSLDASTQDWQITTLNPIYTPHELSHQLNASKEKYLVTKFETLDKVSSKYKFAW